jgi:D-cysteine desulfhydrase
VDVELTLPRRAPLANLPTRVTELNRVSEELGGPLITVKRDDQTGMDLSGNKVRKLEYLLADAQDRGCTVVVTCGAVQSNHCRATAVACRLLGLDSLLVLRGEPPDVADGNLLLDRLVGARLTYITMEDWKRRHEIMEEAAAQLRGEGEKPYVIPEGGSNGLGAWGYVSMISELLDESARVPFSHIVCAVGSGGTLAGLLLGRAILNVDVEIWGFNVCDDAAYFRGRVDEITREFNELHGTSFRFKASDYEIVEGYKGPAYGVPYGEQIEWMKRAARTEALFLDPVYTGKAFFGLVDQIEKGRLKAGDSPLFIHTGGLFGLFPHREKF